MIFYKFLFGILLGEKFIKRILIEVKLEMSSFVYIDKYRIPWFDCINY